MYKEYIFGYNLRYLTFGYVFDLLQIKVPPTAREIRKTQSPADKQTQQPKKRDPPDWFQSYMKDVRHLTCVKVAKSESILISE